MAAVAAITLVSVGAIMSLGTYMAPIEGYRRTADNRQLIVIALIRPGESVIGPELREDSDKVVIGVRARVRGGTGVDLGIREMVIITLGGPLQNRLVVDWNGQALHEQH